MHRSASLPVLLATLAVAVIGAGPAAAQSNCQWYGSTSLKQQQQNEKLKCGFTGPEWNTDLARHLAWCGSVPPDVWKASAQKRDQMLAECMKKAR